MLPMIKTIRNSEFRSVHMYMYVKYVEYNLWTNHAFVYDSHYKPLHQTKCCGVLIDNRADAPFCVLKGIDRASKKQLDHALKEFFGGKCHVEIVCKITPC